MEPDIEETWISGGEPVTVITHNTGGETRIEQQARHDELVTFLKLPENYPED